MFIPIVIPVNPPCDSHKVSLTHVSPMLNGLTHGIPIEIPRFSTSQEDYSVCFLPNDHSVLPRGRLSAADRALARSSPNADEVPRGSQGRKLMAFNGDQWGFIVLSVTIMGMIKLFIILSVTIYSTHGFIYNGDL